MPFTIEIVEPKVPLVRDGSMNLKVVATRKEGFNAPIAVHMLYNPPGVGSSGSIVIPEGQNEALIPLTANSGAEIGKWKIVVLGDATVGDGPITVASQMATLEDCRAVPGLQLSSGRHRARAADRRRDQGRKEKDFEGPAKVELLGLPNEVTTEPKEITKDSTELVFPVKTTANSPAGRHKTVICRAMITANGEPIAHTLGTGELRIDTPLPPKADQPPPAAAAACRRGAAARAAGKATDPTGKTAAGTPTSQSRRQGRRRAAK